MSSHPTIETGGVRRDLTVSGPQVAVDAVLEAVRSGRKVTIRNAKGRAVLICLPDPLWTTGRAG